MSEKALRNIFIFGTIIFFVILLFMTYDSLSQVTSTRTPELTDEVVEGKRTWQQKNCNDCHTILGIGGYYAPELTKVSDRWQEADLKRFLKDPKGTMPGSTMPNQDLSDTDVNNIVAFFSWVGRIDTNNWPPEPLLAGGGYSGKSLFSQKGCTKCHQAEGIGTGMDLARIGSRPGISESYLEEFLENPQQVKPGTTMPSPNLNSDEAQALANYLAGLK